VPASDAFDSAAAGSIRVLVVDDTPDVRAVVRLVLEDDVRFTVVGEAVDGVEGIDQAGALQPDVVLLDRSMPRLNGLEALPRIRQVAPFAEVILYTAEYDTAVHQAAIAAGAADVMPKSGSLLDLSGKLADALLRQWSNRDAGLTVRVGPVPSSAALDWIDNTGRIIDAVRRHPELTVEPVDPAVLRTFDDYLATWREVAAGDDTFSWVASASPEDVERLVGAWATIDAIPEERLVEVGCSFSSPTGRIFFSAVTTAIAEAVAHHEATSALAQRLRGQWLDGR
jgi:CheY-like chemotaxis protein